jgi:membrane-associated protein
MRFSLYVLFSIIGGIVWTDGVLLLGRWLGHIKVVRDTIAPKIDFILIAVVVLSLLPTLIHWWRTRGHATGHSEPAGATDNLPSA